jgi:hypothetical protein
MNGPLLSWFREPGRGPISTARAARKGNGYREAEQPGNTLKVTHRMGVVAKTGPYQPSNSWCCAGGGESVQLSRR